MRSEALLATINHCIEILELENEIMRTNPRTGETVPPYKLNDINRECYHAHIDAIKCLKLYREVLEHQ